MDATVKSVIQECAKASREQRISFGEVVMKQVGAGVERYHADLVRAETTRYLNWHASLPDAVHRS
jgi:uncharacterized protein YbcV (DUF1398 family)